MKKYKYILLIVISFFFIASCSGLQYDGAIKRRDFLNARELAKKLAESDLDSALYKAVIINDYDTVKILVERGANVNAIMTDANNMRELHLPDCYSSKSILFCVQERNIAEYLLEKGAEIPLLGSSRLLSEAIHKRKKDLAMFYLEKNITVTREVFISSVGMCDIDIVNAFLSRGQSLKDVSSYTPILIYALDCDDKFFESLIKMGADINSAAGFFHAYNRTAFHQAVSTCNYQKVILLKKHGAISKPDGAGKHPIDLVSHDCLQLLRELR